MTKIAKNVSFIHRMIVFFSSFNLSVPFSSCRPKDSGMAAPMLKRKKGKMRSTHVMP